MTAPIALLDANVLVPPILRGVLFAAADAGLIAPRWTDRIEGEWAHAAQKGTNPPPAALIALEIEAARARYPGARVAGWEAHEGPLSLPDWRDRHVLAGAIAAGAALLVTNNLRDFPRRRLAAHGVTPEAPDALLWRLLGEAEPGMVAALAAFRETLPPDLAAEPLPTLLKRARLPRLAKALG